MKLFFKLLKKRKQNKDCVESKDDCIPRGFKTVGQKLPFNEMADKQLVTTFYERYD